MQNQHNTIDPTGQRSFPSISIETSSLIKFFQEKTEGFVATYRELEELVGRSCRPDGSGYRYLCSAKKILLRDFNMVLDAEPKVGVRVCTNEETMVVAGRDQKRGRRAILRSRQKLTTVEYDRLDKEKKVEWNARMSLLGALDLITTPKAVRKVEKIASEHVMPSASVLELFKG